MEAKIVYQKDVALGDLGGGVSRRVLAYNEQLMIVEVHLKRAAWAASTPIPISRAPMS